MNGLQNSQAACVFLEGASFAAWRLGYYPIVPESLDIPAVGLQEAHSKLNARERLDEEERSIHEPDLKRRPATRLICIPNIVNDLARRFAVERTASRLAWSGRRLGPTRS
jgi:hypothetical protein